MYSLRDYLLSVAKMSADDITSDVLFCTETDLSLTFFTNQMQEALACFSFTLVCEGWLRIDYNGSELTFHAGDLFIYSPGFPITIQEGSDDYHAVCLIADEHMTLELPVIWKLIRADYYPIAQFNRPLRHLDESHAMSLCRRMLEIADYAKSAHKYRDECLQMLYSLFLLDLMNAVTPDSDDHHYSERTVNLLVNFFHLLPVHFREHHDVGFYADRLHITTTHLSRVVKQVTGRTVVDYINQMLLMEASWLLKTSDDNVASIAEKLHFADQSSFCKFFVRMKGISPKAYR